MPPAITSAVTMALWTVRGEAADAVGDNGAAETSWRMVIAAAPGDWRAWSNLGDTFARQDDWSSAADALGKAASLAPNEPPLQQRYAAALAKAGSNEKCAEQLRRILDAHPEDVESRLSLARVCRKLGRDDDACRELESAARRIGKPDKASVALRRAADPTGDSEIALARAIALELERANRMDTARSLLLDLQSRGIRPQQLGYPIALIALRDGNAASAKESLLGEDPQLDPLLWHALMSRIEETLGDAPSAFAEAASMHLAVPDYEHWRQKAGDYLQKIAGLEAAVNAKWVGRLNALDPDGRRSPAFLVGFPRSGTTLLDTFLRGHPDTQVVEEQPMLDAAEGVIGNYATLPDQSADQLERARRAYFAELDRHVEAGFRGLVIDKLPLNMLGLPLVWSLFPDTRIIFAQRHPCDVVLSCFLRGFAINDAMACFLDLKDTAQLYDVAMRLFSSSCELLPLKVHKLVYEELVENPEAALRPAVEFLGLDWRPEVLDHQATAKSRASINTPSYAQVVNPLEKTPSGRWRRYQKQLEPVLPLLLPWAARMGYR